MAEINALAPLMTELELPAPTQLDAYQATVAGQVIHDAGAQTVRGFEPAQYFHNGLVEELGETTGEDRVHTRYNRLGAILMLDSEAGRFDGGEVSPLAIELHQKEFGDVSWYLANRLHTVGITLSQAIQDGFESHDHEAATAPKCPPEVFRQLEQLFPFAFYFGYSKELMDASRAALDQNTVTTRRNLSAAGGKLVLAMAQLAESRLDTTYQHILDQNLAKIAKRVANGTVFDKSGGDTR